MKLFWVFVFFLFLVAGNLAAQPQSIMIDVVGVSLKEVLLGLSKKYGIQLAFDDNLLSKYNITTSHNFTSIETALDSLVVGLPLKIEKNGDVFMVVPLPGKTKKKELIRATGQVLEAGTFEPLPFSYILINNKHVQSDLDGKFTFLASTGPSYKMQISHLGYFIYDTIFSNSFKQRFFLKPSATQLNEIEIYSKPTEKSTLIGDKPGNIKLNNAIIPYLPGYGDNSVINFLRMMPGIQAAGEQSSGLYIWGSYDSHSKVEFDGFTLFGLKNYDDNIGVVNPLIMKNIEVYKGGYEAKYGDKVGGIVVISGKNGSLQKPNFTFNINNTTLNTLAEAPLSKKSSVMAAYRQTYYELYDPASLVLSVRKKTDTISATLKPDYNFRDANLKYTYNGVKTMAHVSFYGGGDKYTYNLETEVGQNSIYRYANERNLQYGGSISVSNTWGNGNTSRLVVGYSTLWNESEDQNKVINHKRGIEKVTKEGDGKNSIRQLSVLQNNRVNFTNGYYIEIGVGLESNDVYLVKNLAHKPLFIFDSRANRLISFLQGFITVGDYIEIKPGVRANYLTGSEDFYLNPRISGSANIAKGLKFNASWGVYNQFLAKASFVDSTFNYYYFWTNSDNVTFPVLKSKHLVGGLSYNNKFLTASIEGYYKNTEGLTRFYNGGRLVNRGFYNGQGRSFGLDLYLKTEVKNQLAWVSYTLSKSEEYFPFFKKGKYRPSPQDQRHEIKFAGVLNFKQFYLSANYIYGSGFTRFLFYDNDDNSYIPDYKRLDMALIYKLKPGIINGEIGVSILNVLDTNNIKFENLHRVANGNENQLDIHSEAMPFTPTLFLKIKL